MKNFEIRPPLVDLLALKKRIEASWSLIKWLLSDSSTTWWLSRDIFRLRKCKVSSVNHFFRELGIITKEILVTGILLFLLVYMSLDWEFQCLAIMPVGISSLKSRYRFLGFLEFIISICTNILCKFCSVFIVSWIIGIQKRGMQDLNSKFCLIFLNCIQFNDSWY